jgi:hypothetical protein
MMPHVDGSEFCRRIKGDPVTAPIPFIMLTAKVGLEMKIDGLHCGADDYLMKPFDERELKARVRSLLRLRRLNLDLDKRNCELQEAYREVTTMQSQLIHAEKMSSLGQLVAGLAHEINNAINAVYNGIKPLRSSTDKLDGLLSRMARDAGDKLDPAMLKDIAHLLRRISSLGNVIEPAEICNQWGADLLRLWVTSVEYQADVKMSERVLTQLSEAYRKIRNTFRFALGNLSDFDPVRNLVANDQLDDMDRWILERTADLVKKCREWYAAYEFHRVYHAIHDYCVVDLSAFYYDVLKDRLYTAGKKSIERRSSQTAMAWIGSALLRTIAPILSFTANRSFCLQPR